MNKSITTRIHPHDGEKIPKRRDRGYHALSVTDIPQLCDKDQPYIDITAAFTTTQRFDTREVVVSWAREIGIRNKVTVTITRSDKETGKRGRSNKIIFNKSDKKAHINNTSSSENNISVISMYSDSLSN
ncbi:hypothetical protein MTR_3g074290 [Medicago truncatula]|uniref:Uncharacterized protein n=1 Tax=Medicago truncatula TaxID=3880 RepID=A0A072UYR8_MEDTR|nr:hypothetical protein MTR_3g074290 [Medicago truncatula]